MASVDADFEQPFLEPDRAPCIAASRREGPVRRPVDITTVKVGVEDVALQAFAGLLHEFSNAPETQAERFSEDLVKGVALNRIVGNFRYRDRLPRKKPAAVHVYKAFFVALGAIARTILLTLEPSNPYSAFVLHPRA